MLVLKQKELQRGLKNSFNNSDFNLLVKKAFMNKKKKLYRIVFVCFGICSWIAVFMENY